MLDARIARRLGSFTLDVAFTAQAGAVVVLIGENGAGKTTVLRALAGVEPIDAGRVSLDATVLDDPAAGVRVPPHRRRVGWVPQETALFPHLTVEENVEFGPAARGLERGEVRTRAAAAMERLGVSAFARRHPPTLSGGQRQRVALARALATAPALLLLDEPLAALDARARREVRHDLAALLPALHCPTVLVTHSPRDAAGLGREVLVLEAGRIAHRGSPGALLQSGASPQLEAMASEEALDERLFGP